jgi:Type-1V conjugative transfer system mating pair stabilisation
MRTLLDLRLRNLIFSAQLIFLLLIMCSIKAYALSKLDKYRSETFVINNTTNIAKDYAELQAAAHVHDKNKVKADAVNLPEISEQDNCLSFQGQDYCNNLAVVEADNEQVDTSRDLASFMTTVAAASDSSGRVDNPSIFGGQPATCKYYPLNMRDCCKDSGILEDVFSCPRELFDLQQAKIEGRALSLGHYKDSKAVTRYVYCIFPHKIAKLIQDQGRAGQLHIGFHSLMKPDCRGISLKEFQALDLAQIDFTELGAEIKAMLSQKTINPKSLEEQIYAKI